MSMVSYAQNFEDVMLWRALRTVASGCYIDVGAQDPRTDSVSLTFYDRGWRGVHVEPNAYYTRRLREARPDEVVIEAALSNKSGLLTLYEVPESGLSTGQEALARVYRRSGYEVVAREVPCLTLANILERFAERDVHWLKIDVEGMESLVLQGWAPSLVRPWVVVIESIDPITRQDTHDEWCELIEQLGYVDVYFDGVNRFYLSAQHLELRGMFTPGPNIFDDFVLSGTSSSTFCSLLNSKIDALTHELSAVQTEMGSVQSELDRARLRVQEIESWLARRELQMESQLAEWRMSAERGRHDLLTVYESHSWRITRPLRFIGSLLKGLRQTVASKQGVRSSGMFYPRAVRAATGFVGRHPALSQMIRRMVRRLPGIYLHIQKARSRPMQLMHDVEPFDQSVDWDRHSEATHRTFQRLMANQPPSREE